MKTPDTTRTFRDPAAYPESKDAAAYWRDNPGPEQPRSATATDRWKGETAPIVEDDAPGGSGRAEGND